MSEPRSPAWYAKPFTLSFPVGIIAVVVTALVSAGAAGGVGSLTRDGDLDAVDVRLEAAKEDLRRELAATASAAEQLQSQRQEEILRRLERIEARIDGAGR